MARRIAGLVFVLFVVALTARVQAAEPAKTGSAPIDHRPLIDELLKGRKQILRGEFHGKGHKIFTILFNKPDGTAATDRGEFTFACRFDYPKNTVTFEREYPEFLIEPEKPSAKVAIWSYRFRRDEKGEFFAEYPGPLPLNRFPLQEVKDKKQMSPYCKPFDVRTFGLEGESTLISGTTFEETSESLAKGKIASVEKTTDERFMVVGQPNPAVQIRFWIHPGRGHTADRLEVHVADPAAGGKYERKSLSTCQWEERNSVWVPVSMKGENQFNGPESWEIELKWDRVNE